MKNIIVVLLLILYYFLSPKEILEPLLSPGVTPQLQMEFLVWGYNPGLIGLQHNNPLNIQAFQLDFGIVGNFFSIENIAKYSGDTLSTRDVNRFFNTLEQQDGLTFFMDTHMPIPLINISKGNLAFSANNILLQNYKLPIGLLELIFYGNAKKA